MPRPAEPGGPAKDKGKPGEVSLGSDAMIARYGYTHRILYSPDADTLAKLKEEAQQWLRAISEPRKSIPVSHPGIPKIKRGDSIRLALPDMQIRDYWVTEAHWVISPGAFDMEVIMSSEDPFVDTIIDKLTDTATERDRVPPKKKPKKGNKPKDHGSKSGSDPSNTSDQSGDQKNPGAFADQGGSQ